MYVLGMKDVVEMYGTRTAIEKISGIERRPFPAASEAFV